MNDLVERLRAPALVVAKRVDEEHHVGVSLRVVLIHVGTPATGGGAPVHAAHAVAGHELAHFGPLDPVPLRPRDVAPHGELGAPRRRPGCIDRPRDRPAAAAAPAVAAGTRTGPPGRERPRSRPPARSLPSGCSGSAGERRTARPPRAAASGRSGRSSSGAMPGGSRVRTAKLGDPRRRLQRQPYSCDLVRPRPRAGRSSSALALSSGGSVVRLMPSDRAAGRAAPPSRPAPAGAGAMARPGAGRRRQRSP